MLQETSNSFPVKKKQPFSTLTTAEIFHMGIFLMKQHDSLDFLKFMFHFMEFLGFKQIQWSYITKYVDE